MRTRIRNAILGTLVVASVAIPVQMFIDALPMPTVVLTPCPTEDSTDCYWKADARTNGLGQSFISLDDESYPYPVNGHIVIADTLYLVP